MREMKFGWNFDKEAEVEKVVSKVLEEMRISPTLKLHDVKKLIESIEEKAVRENQAVAIAVCNGEGNPIAVHRMDEALLVSFDVALKKAYTSVALKMSTRELGRLAAPGGMFYGLDKMDDGKMVMFGGGIPLMKGKRVIGGLGISGGTAEEDHALAEYGKKLFEEMVREK